MASIFSHALAALALGTVVRSDEPQPVRFWMLGAICAAAPDADVITFKLGVPYGDMLGHRGLTHSLLVAALAAALVVKLAFPKSRAGVMRQLWVFFFVATASHGVLDALTDGGVGVAFLAPFSNARYFFPWRPIRVSPIGIGPFLSHRGLSVLASELRWIWAPSAILASMAWYCRRGRQAVSGAMVTKTTKT
jgi:inner membrane protein